MTPLHGDEEELKEWKGLKMLTPTRSLTRLPMLLVQVKAGNISYKLKKESTQILYISFQHNKITKKNYNNLIMLL